MLPKPLVVLMGPTASGKTALALRIAPSVEGEIVNCDTRLFYRGFDIGTSKPSSTEQQQAPHHLIDFLDPDENFSLAKFLPLVKRTIEEIRSRDKVPLLVGGSGQYIKALLSGWQVPDIEPDPELRVELQRLLEEKGIEALRARLEKLNPEYAHLTDQNNPPRLIRAIERSLHAPDSSIPRFESSTEQQNTLVLALHIERAVLHERVHQRLRDMFATGWVDEVARLRSEGVTIASPAMKAIGYKEVARVLDGELSEEEAIVEIRKATHRLIRQQYNWFKRIKDNVFVVEHQDHNAALKLVRERLVPKREL